MNGIPVISDTIRKLCNEGVTTQAELAGVAHVSESTVSRWSSDIGGPDFTHVCRWIQSHPRLEARRAFRRCVPIVDTPIEADINGDGVVDRLDVIDGARGLVNDTARLNYVIGLATRDDDITAEESALISSTAAELKLLVGALEVAADCSAIRRRKAVAL